MEVEQWIEAATPVVAQWGLRVVGAIFVLLIGRIVAGTVRRATNRALARGGLDETARPFVAGIVYYLALAVVVIAVLRLFGIETTSLIAVLGAAGLAVGLALQGTLSNFASGVMLLLFRPFKIGDYVEVGGTSGSVMEIGIFSTVLKSPDNIRITVPNSKIYGDTIHNFNGFETRRIDLTVGISYDDDIEKALSTVKQVLASDSRVLADPEPVVAVSELGGSSVDLVVRPWCAAGDYWPLRWDLTRKLKETIEAAGCSFPYPQHDVHLRNGADVGPPIGS